MRTHARSALVALTTLLTIAAAHVHAERWDRNVIVPQQRCYAPDGPRLEVTSVNASVHITERVATTTLAVLVTNNTGVRQEGEMLMPISHNATVRSFTIDGIGDGTAKILRREEARQIYEEIVRTMRDPGLLEFAGFAAIRSSIFPVEPNATRTLTLTYEHVVDGVGGRFDYAIPRSELFESSAIDWQVDIDINDRQPISTVYSPSHAIRTTRVSDNQVRIALTPDAAKQPGPFRISYLLQVDGVSASVLACPDTDDTQGGYVMLLAGLPTKLEQGDETQAREIQIVIDRSGSMRGEKIVQARDAAIAVLDGLRNGESFNIIDYSDTIATFSAQPVEKNAKTLADARAYLSSLKAEGGTNIHDALQQAVRQPVTEGTLPMVLFLTDGLATAGTTSEVTIRKHTANANTNKRRIFTFGVGFDVNAPLLDKLAEASRGSSINVLPGENIEVAVSTVFKRLAGPILALPSIDAIDADGNQTTRALRDITPTVLPDLFEGDQLVVLARYTNNDPLTLRLAGTFLGEEQTFSFPFDPNQATLTNSFVPRLWATRRIANLVDQVRQSGANGDSLDPTYEPSPGNEEIVEEIVRLSMRFGILTEYTSFLATENTGADQIALKDAVTSCSSNLQDAVVENRAGQWAVSQSMNIKQAQSAANANRLNSYRNADMEEVTITNVCQLNDQTMFNRGDRWIDARLVVKEDDQDTEAPEPTRTIVFGSKEHFELAQELAKDGRQALLAFPGEVFIVHAKERILITMPAEEDGTGPEEPATK